MSLTPFYLISTKNLAAFLNTIKGAQAPNRVTTDFLKRLGYTSSNDRMFIGLLKALGFTDDAARPTQRYFHYLDDSESRAILAEAVREAYGELFSINRDAQKMSLAEVKSKLKTLTQGKKSDVVIKRMADTFKKLAALGDFSSVQGKAADMRPTLAQPEGGEAPSPETQGRTPRGVELHYNIQIHLPESRDPAVFEAIFSAITRHLR